MFYGISTFVGYLKSNPVYNYSETKETKQFWGKISEPKKKTQKTNEKAEWINNMKKELQRLEEDPDANIHLVSLRETPQKSSKLENIRL